MCGGTATIQQRAAHSHACLIGCEHVVVCGDGIRERFGDHAVEVGFHFNIVVVFVCSIELHSNTTTQQRRYRQHAETETTSLGHASLEAWRAHTAMCYVLSAHGGGDTGDSRNFADWGVQINPQWTERGEKVARIWAGVHSG